MLEIKVDDTHTAISCKATTKADYLIDFANAVTCFAYEIGKCDGTDLHDVLKELGLLILAIADEDKDQPSFHIHKEECECTGNV